jgi:hypothetical protein
MAICITPRLVVRSDSAASSGPPGPRNGSHRRAPPRFLETQPSTLKSFSGKSSPRRCVTALRSIFPYGANARRRAQLSIPEGFTLSRAGTQVVSCQANSRDLRLRLIAFAPPDGWGEIAAPRLRARHDAIIKSSEASAPCARNFVPTQ